MGLTEQLIEERKALVATDRDLIGNLFQSMDEGKDFVSGDDNYVWFYLIGKTVRPRVIAEMGTRFGYSMKCFTEGAGHSPDEFRIRSFDAECDGIKTLHVFEAFFRSKGVSDVVVTRADTQSLTSLGLDGECDLVMVDGMHTVGGCLHECRLGWAALKPGGVMVVDDTNYPDPAEGLRQFCESVGATAEFLPSLRGISLVVKSQA